LSTSLTAGGHRRIPAQNLLELLKKLNLPLPDELKILDETQQPFKILVVDDEPSIRQMIRWAISDTWPSVEIEEAQDGMIAGWLAKGFHPNLIVLDLMMPALDGFRFCELVRSAPELIHTKIIAMSGVHSNDKEILKIGADDFLPKPFDLDVLRKAVSKYIEAFHVGK
jgi:two-component system, OmpR family, response regulator RpaA